jgi:hypothetical protein
MQPNRPSRASGAIAMCPEQVRSKFQVGGGGVGQLPLVAAERHRAEAARAVQLLAAHQDLGRGGQPEPGRGLRVPPLVAGLDVGEEAVVAAGDMVGGDDRQGAAGPQRVGRLGHPHGRVDPVEGGRGQDHVERVRGQRPVLERADHHLHAREAGELAAGHRRQAGAELDRDDPAAPLGQRHGRLAGPGPISSTRQPGPTPAGSARSSNTAGG